MNQINNPVILWCIANRQWRRQDNLAHALWQAQNASTEEDKEFWTDVALCFNETLKIK